MDAQQSQMLQVPLCPTAVSCDEICKRGRATLKGALQGGRQMHFPAGPAQECCFDEVVAEDVATQWRFAGKLRQSRRLCECVCSDDRIMTSVVASGPMPRGQSRREELTIVTAGKLLQPREASHTSHEARHGLNQTCAGVRLQSVRQTQHDIGGHNAVSVEYDEVWIGRTEPFNPIANVSSLLCSVWRSPAHVNLHGCAARTKFNKRGLLERALRGVLCVT